MKKFGLIGLMLVAGLSVFSQKEEAARNILDKVASTYKAYGSFSIEFSVVMENKEEDVRESSNGCADIKDGKYKVCAMGTEIYFDGKTRYTFIKDAEEVNISEVDEEEEDDSMMNPAKIFDLYKTGFNYKVLKEYKEAGKTFVNIELDPINKEVEYSAIIVKVEKMNSHVESFQTVGKDGNNVMIKLVKLYTDRKFEDKHFVFDTKANPDVEVVDMR